MKAHVQAADVSAVLKKAHVQPVDVSVLLNALLQATRSLMVMLHPPSIFIPVLDTKYLETNIIERKNKPALRQLLFFALLLC